MGSGIARKDSGGCFRIGRGLVGGDNESDNVVANVEGELECVWPLCEPLADCVDGAVDGAWLSNSLDAELVDESEG